MAQSSSLLRYTDDDRSKKQLIETDTVIIIKIISTQYL